MKKRVMAHTDLELGSICLGTGNFGEKLDRDKAYAVLDRFRELGGSFIDTAGVYCRWIPGMGNSSEQYIGAWLKDRHAYQDMVVATKGGHYDFADPNTSRVNKVDITRDLDLSLRTLGLDRIDLYWLHRDDENLDVGEILEFMEEFVKEGKLRYYGASNFKRERLELAAQYAEKHGLKGFCAVSNQWSAASVNPGKNLNQDKSLVMMDREFYQWHKKRQIPMIPFSSSAHGFFSKLEQEGILEREGIPGPNGDVTEEEVERIKGRSRMPEDMKAAYMNRRNLKLYGIFRRAADSLGVSMYCMTQAYLLHSPFQVFPVGAVSRPEQLADSFAACECVLDKQLIREMEECGVE